MQGEILFLATLEVVVSLDHLDLAFPVVPRAHDTQSLDEQAGADLDAVVLQDRHELLLWEDLDGCGSTCVRGGVP